MISITEQYEERITSRIKSMLQMQEILDLAKQLAVYVPGPTGIPEGHAKL
jgi:hypothetical protein